MVVRVETPESAGGAGMPPERAVALVREALARAAAEMRVPEAGRIARIRVRVDAAGAGDSGLATRIGRAIRAAVADRAAFQQPAFQRPASHRDPGVTR
ncbi:hypothetical protein ACIBQ1_24130 [Nonomuraea sp. NPDC050153]|uniref:hypothetical protein n=1 Tax=Nonomuraea sp. NPDC050153 TaxID=3364359 RepID=UPI00379A387A